MDKTKIKNFAITAREKLIESVTDRLNEIDITEDHLGVELPISTPDKKYYKDETHPLTGSQIKWRQEIIRELQARNYAQNPKQVFNDFVEEVAYTWFNRIIAIRFMEVNNYLPSRVRVLSSEEGNSEPNILNEALDIEDDLGGYSEAERQLINEALMDRLPQKLDAAYTMLFIKQNDALAKILPGLFEQTKGYLKLLFTPKYTTGVIQSLITDIPEADFDVSQEGQVQIIGWLYQYYNTVPKDKAFKKKNYQASDIPAVTQLFTPDWIVKYMVQNSLGRYWINILLAKGDDRSEAKIATDFNWEYYVPSSDQNSVVRDATLADKEVTDIKFIDPSMGSGHVLIYAFDVLMQIYATNGYSHREAAKLILENNLTGLDIDTRAYQLSYFALMMKARENDRRIFRREIQPSLYDVPEIHYNYEDYEDLIEQSGVDKTKVEKPLKELLQLFKEGNDLGSIIKIDKSWDLDEIEKIAKFKEENVQLSLLDSLVDKQKELQEIVETARALQLTYDVGVTNPPYMGGGKMDKELKKYVQKNYPDSKADMFAVFIEVLLNMVKSSGYVGMVTQHSWMFLSNFEKLRKKLQQTTIINMAHLGTRAFEEIGGEVVQTTAFILQGKKPNGYVGTYERLVDYKSQDGKEEQFLKIQSGEDTKDLYQVNQTNFDKIPGSPIAYWASENLIKDFEDGTPLGDVVEAKVGLQTGNNKRFLRQWFEVNLDNISFNSHNIQESVESKKKWFPYNKGGSYRKWYGNYDYVVNWENDGYDIKHFTWPNGKQRSVVRNDNYYFKESITWSDISIGEFATRFRKYGSIHDVTGMSIFGNNLKWILGFMNSKVMQFIIKILNPTIHAQIGNIINIPIIENDNWNDSIVDESISLTQQDWDAFETSWDFQRSPLLTSANKTASLKESYSNWEQEAESRFNQLKTNEEELNKIFIDLYGLQDELTPEEEDKDVSVRKADKERDIKAFLSYFIGCVFGRYSLDEDGLAYAGGNWDDSKYQTFKPNKDNIILLTDRQYFTDERDIIIRLKEFLTAIFSEDTLTDNLDFIAQTLSPKNFEKGDRAEDIIRNYFLNDFAKEHAKIYQKRPIYWEFNSGRNKGFKALMYLHRYQPNELAMVRTYLHDLQAGLNNLLEVDKQLLDQAANSRDKSKYRKEINLLNKQSLEQVNYDQILGHLSQLQIELDLDDGILENYQKLQQDKKLLTKI